MKSLSAMKLIDIVPKAALKVPLLGVTKEEILAELVHQLALGPHEQGLKEMILDSVLERESEVSTSVGNGIAIPHGRADIESKVLGAMGVARSPVPYDAIDGLPVRIFVLVVTRPDDAAVHLDALRAVSLFLSDAPVRDAVSTCREVQSLWGLIAGEGRS